MPRNFIKLRRPGVELLVLLRGWFDLPTSLAEPPLLPFGHSHARGTLDQAKVLLESGIPPDT